MQVYSVTRNMNPYTYNNCAIFTKNKTTFAKKDNKKMIGGAITGAGILIIITGLLKKGNFNKSIAKKGLSLKDNILYDNTTGKKFTGKIKSYVGKLGFTKTETQEFVDGVLKEKLYHSLLGKELYGEFYKDGKRVLQIWKSAGQVKNSYGFSYRIEETAMQKPALFVETKEGFAWARNYLKKNN